MVDIFFQKQMSEDYAAAACVQMLTNTEQTQQDIYFRMLRIMQSLRPQDCIDKAKCKTMEGMIIGHKEKICKLLELTLNHFYTNDVFWKVDIAPKFDKCPAIAIFYPQKNMMSQMVKGHPVIISYADKNRVTIFDPFNDGPVDALKMRITPLISTYYCLSQTDLSGNDLTF